MPLPPAFVPPLCLKARISMLKTIPAGTSVSYGATFTAARDTLVATIPLGYADGYTRMLSNRVTATVHGHPVQGIGRICMDQCMFDVTDAAIATGTDTAQGRVRKGEIITLFGPKGVRADDLAAILGTINYEVLCMVGSRVTRIYVE
jgi:Alanine racemase